MGEKEKKKKKEVQILTAQFVEFPV